MFHSSTSTGLFVGRLCCTQQTGIHEMVVEALLITISCRSSACLVRIAGPCRAEPFQLVPAQLGLSPAGPYQLWCTSLRTTTETRLVRNTLIRPPCAKTRREWCPSQSTPSKTFKDLPAGRSAKLTLTVLCRWSYARRCFGPVAQSRANSTDGHGYASTLSFPVVS